jgi:hypothetical protein
MTTHSKRRNIALGVIVLIAVLALIVGFAVDAKGFGGGGGGSKSFGGSSGGSKSYSSGGGSKSSGSSGGSKSYSAPKAPTLSKPSTGSIPQRAPVTKLVPPKPPASLGTPKVVGGRVTPAKVSIPSGHAYQRDRTFLVGHPAYINPYGGLYYGSYDSPFYYMWLGSMMNGGGSDRPLPPEKDGEVSDALESYMGVVQQEAQFMADKAKTGSG